MEMNEKIIEEIIKNLKNPRFYVYLLVLLLVFLLLFPYIDANFFYYRRVNNRIDILTKMAEADLSKIEENPVLSKEYENLLTEIEKQTDGSIGSIFMKDKEPHVQLLKFVTGGSLIWIIAIGVLFSKKNSTGNRLISSVVFGIIGCIAGAISMVLPTVITPMVNYIGFPFLLAIIIVLLAAESMKQKKADNQK